MSQTESRYTKEKSQLFRTLLAQAQRKGYMHTAVSSGSWCGGQRQQCGDSGSGLR